MRKSNMLYAFLVCLSPSIMSAQTPSQHPASHELMGIMNGMCESSSKMTMTGDADSDFVAMMIPHHQAAIDMANAYLKEGKDEKIKGMAKKLISSQKKEVDELKSWQKKHAKDKK